MLKDIVVGFLSTLGRMLANYTQGTVTTRNEYKDTVASLSRSLKSLSAKASDVQEEIKNAEVSGKKKGKREVEHWLTEVQVIETEIGELQHRMQSEGFLRLFFVENQTKNLRERAEKLMEQSRHFGELVLNVGERRGVPLLHRRMVGEKFERNSGKIWELLITNRVSSIGIYGMGGAGKTTLAKYIHNRLLEEYKECVFWVTVFQEFSIRRLQDKIARFVGLDLTDERDDDIRAAILNQELSQKKNFVLILDDVWRNIDLEKVGIPLSLKRGKLIITTRSKEVCDRIGCQERIKVGTLNQSEAWDLFKETLGGETSLTPLVEEIAKCMVQKCGGLPLGIITIAGSMKGKSDLHDWRNALEELRRSIRSIYYDEEVFKILKYSFDQLKQEEEKRCFLDCCLFPEDRKIKRNELIDHFISEELLDKKMSRRKQIDQGHAILNMLVNVCLLENGGSGQNEWVKMHDLVREMALKITDGKHLSVQGYGRHSLKKILNEEEHGMKDMEKISLMYNIQLRKIPVGWSPNYPKLSTLLLQNNEKLELIPSSFLSGMHGLCHLNLSFTAIRELPDSLSDMGSLRTLLLEDCRRLKYVPDLANLKKLKELNLSFTSINEVPQGMEELVNLESLKIRANRLKELRNNLLLNFPNLECLHLPDYIESTTKEIGKLKRLEEFQGYVKEASDLDRLMKSIQASKEHTQSCDVTLGMNNMTMKFRLQHERIVILYRVFLHKEGRRDATTFLPNCLLDDFQKLQLNLKELRISQCSGVQCILKHEESLLAGRESKNPFQNLKKIELSKLSEFSGMMIFERPSIEGASPPLSSPVFSSLKRLDIFECKKMKKLGLPVRELLNLEEISIWGCEEMEEIIEIRDDEGEGGKQQPPLLPALPKLRALNLYSLPKLNTICKAPVLCTSIRLIHIGRCRAVKKWPLIFGEADYHSPPTTLEEIWIRGSEKEWWESLEMEHPSLHPLLLPFIRYN